MFLLKFQLTILLTQIRCSINVDIFYQSPDEMLKELIGDIHEIRKNRSAHEHGHLQKKLGDSYEDYTNYRRLLNDISTTASTDELEIATRTTVLLPPEMGRVTKKQIERRMLMRDLRKMLKDTRNPLDNLEGDVDETMIITRRFASSLQEKPALRGPNRQDTRIKAHQFNETKEWLVDIMTHFVYLARYKLTYVQLLRKKYIESLRYKIGFCSCLLRLLRQQQERIIAAYMQTYQVMHIHDHVYHLRIYERIQKLNTDIKDVARHLKIMDERRQMIESPEYYEFLQYQKQQKESLTRSRSTRKGLDKFTTSTIPATLPQNY